ncbi:MAG: glycosyltransferase family 2 protein [Candidatus Staskawiczbacteria bacterium]|nr:glycosyltransferase family 2 protein [Candidatus Staskawiczbacteria bacterium]
MDAKINSVKNSVEAEKGLTEEDLSKEFTKDFYRVDYLSGLKINSRKRKEDMSAVIPTYNRCPFDKNSENYKYNPLSVCISALLLQKSSIKEIIVVDDASTDNTKKVVEELAAEAYSKKGIEIKYFLNSERKGSSASRNIGAKHASGKYLYFLDDDCVPTPHLTFIAMIVIKKIEKADKNFAALVLPVYDRASFPKIALPVSELTKSFFKRGTKGAYFNSIPKEYLTAKGRFINKTLKIFKPIQVYQTWGHFIIDRTKYLDVGGFPDFATWPNKAGEEQEFACRLIENAYTLYYLPENKASSSHGAYGAKIGGFEGYDWLKDISNGRLSLIEFFKICDEGIMSGNRVNVEDYCYSKIIASFCIIYKRNTKEAINWARTSYQEFVTDDKKMWYPLYAKGQTFPHEKREEIWHKAINDGLNLLFDNEQKKLVKLDGFIQSLKIKGGLEEEIKMASQRHGETK